jgi:hypothetical protein
VYSVVRLNNVGRHWELENARPSFGTWILRLHQQIQIRHGSEYGVNSQPLQLTSYAWLLVVITFCKVSLSATAYLLVLQLYTASFPCGTPYQASVRPIKDNMVVAQTLHGNTAESKSFDISRTDGVTALHRQSICICCSIDSR